MTSSARQARTPITILISLTLTLLLFATTGVNQAQAADNYNREPFPNGSCTGLHNSGSRDGAGNVYVPCGNPSIVRVYNPAGDKIKDIPLGFYASDVAPAWDGNTLYAAQVNPAAGGKAIAVRRLTKKLDGSFALNDTISGGDWALASYTRNGTRVAKGFKIATDAQGFLYVADGAGGNTDANGDEISAVVKYNSSGDLVTHFGGNAKSGGPFYGLLAGIAVSEDGNRVYAAEGNYNVAGSAEKGNHILRFDKQAGASTYTRTQKWGGNYDPNVGCEYHELGETFTGTWLNYFAAPWDIGLDSAENMYVVNATCREVLKFTPNFQFLVGMKVGDVNNAEPQNLGKPHGLAVAKNGEVYIGEANAKMNLPPDEPPPAPNTILDPNSGPAANTTTTSRTASFSFSADPAAGATFECKLAPVEASFSACATPKSYSALADAQYTFSVRAKNASGGTDATPATRTWTVSNTPPPGTCKGQSNTMTGSDDPNVPDNLTGRTGLKDVISARSGDDTIGNLDNTDVACGGSGYDTFTRFSGSVLIDGAGDGTEDNASDVVDFSWITQADANGRGAYVALGGISDGSGFEVTTSNVADAKGSSFPDSMYGDNMRNTIYGGAGNDTIVGGAEAAGANGDSIFGDAGSDTIKVRDGARDTVYCGESADDFDTVEADTIDIIMDDPNTAGNDCEQVDRPDTVAPVVTPISPKPGSAIRDRTPTIRATVRDNVTDLAKSDVKLYVGQTLISDTKYSYNSDTDTLAYNSTRLPLGKNTVKVVATDAATNVGVRTWSFTIRR